MLSTTKSIYHKWIMVFFVCCLWMKFFFKQNYHTFSYWLVLNIRLSAFLKLMFPRTNPLVTTKELKCNCYLSKRLRWVYTSNHIKYIGLCAFKPHWIYWIYTSKYIGYFGIVLPTTLGVLGLHIQPHWTQGFTLSITLDTGLHFQPY